MARSMRVVGRFALLLGLPATALAQPSSAVCGTTGTGKQICVRFDNRSTAPTSSVDFDFVLSDPPGVVFNVGEDGGGTLQWRVWCTVSNVSSTPSSIGSITRTSTNDHNYSVKILNASGGAGASNLDSLVLTPGSGKHSNLDNAHITGDLTGNLTLQSYTGTGGNIVLDIEGDVGSGSTITALHPIIEIDGDMGGTIALADGLDVYDEIEMDTLSGTIDMGYDPVGNPSGGRLTGYLVAYGGGSGDIVNGGVIDASRGNAPQTYYSLVLGSTDTDVYSGTATFTGVLCYDPDYVESGIIIGELQGKLHFTGDVIVADLDIGPMTNGGRLIIDGSFTPGAWYYSTIRVDSMDDTSAVVVDYDARNCDEWLPQPLLGAGRGKRDRLRGGTGG